MPLITTGALSLRQSKIGSKLLCSRKPTDALVLTYIMADIASSVTSISSRLLRNDSRTHPKLHPVK